MHITHGSGLSHPHRSHPWPAARNVNTARMELRSARLMINAYRIRGGRPPGARPLHSPRPTFLKPDTHKGSSHDARKEMALLVWSVVREAVRGGAQLAQLALILGHSWRARPEVGRLRPEGSRAPTSDVVTAVGCEWWVGGSVTCGHARAACGRTGEAAGGAAGEKGGRSGARSGG
eukprot:2355441-Prymnesium_polylepis.1